MEYYIVINEWNYPTESGREFIDDFDTIQEAETCAESECDKELDNFIEACGDYYREGSGRTVNEYLDCIGYELNSSSDENNNYFFRSAIIMREV